MYPLIVHVAWLVLLWVNDDASVMMSAVGLNLVYVCVYKLKIQLFRTLESPQRKSSVEVKTITSSLSLRLPTKSPGKTTRFFIQDSRKQTSSFYFLWNSSGLLKHFGGRNHLLFIIKVSIQVFHVHYLPEATNV